MTRKLDNMPESVAISWKIDANWWILLVVRKRRILCFPMALFFVRNHVGRELCNEKAREEGSFIGIP